MNKTISITIFIIVLVLVFGPVIYILRKHSPLIVDLSWTSLAVILLIVSAIVLYTSLVSSPTTYGCDSMGKCVKMVDGKFNNNKCDNTCIPPPPPPPPSPCMKYDAKLSGLTCTPIQPDQALNSTNMKKDHIYLRYYSREPTINDMQSGGNYLQWIFNQVNVMVAGDILLMQTDFFEFDTVFIQNLIAACNKGALVYLIVDRWQDWGCPYPNNWSDKEGAPQNCLNPSITYQGKLPAENNCKSIDAIITQTKNIKNFIIVDLAGGCSGTGKTSCKSPGCPTYDNKPLINTQSQPGDTATGRENPVHAHRKIVSFYSKSRNVGSVYKGSMNVQTNPKGTSGVREVGWGISALLNDPFMKGHIQHDLNTIEWFFPDGVIPDYGYKIKDNQTVQNQANYNLASQLRTLGPQYSKDNTVLVTLNWSAPDFSQLDDKPHSQIGWISGVDPNVTVRLAINPPGLKQAIPPIIYDDTVDIFGNVNFKGPGIPSWTQQQQDLFGRTGNLQWDTDKDKSPEFASGSTWGGTLIMQMLANAIKNKSKYVKIHMYNYLYGAMRPCNDTTGISYSSGSSNGYSKDGITGKGTDIGKTVASLMDPIPVCDSSIKVDTDSWHENLQPEFVRALYDYMDSNVGKLLVVSGTPMRSQDSCCTADWCGNTKKCMVNTSKQCATNNDCAEGQPPTDLNSYLLLQLNKAGPQYDTGASKNQYWRWYTLGSNANCDSEQPGTNQFCKSHEKLWFTDSDVLIASGHPTRGYYSDFNSICDDILLENAYSFVDAYNNMYTRIWSKHSVGPIYTGGKNGTGPTNPNWGTWNGTIGNIIWTPPAGGSTSPLADLGCASCFGTMNNNNYCSNSNSLSQTQECMYNLI